MALSGTIRDMYRHLPIIILAGIAFLAQACRTPERAEAPAAAVAPAPAPPDPVVETLVGRITLLGAGNSFVIFLLEPGQSASIGEELEVRFAGARVATIKITPPDKKNRFFAADVIEGTVEKGYEVVRVEGGKAGESAAKPGP